MISVVASASEHAASEAGVPPEAVGLLAFAALMGLLFVTMAFRSVGTRH